MSVALLALCAGAIAHRSAERFEQISKDREEQSSRDQSRARATEVEGLLFSYIDKAKVVASLLMKDSSATEEKAKAIELTFGRDKDFVALEVLSRDKNAQPMRVVNEAYLKQYKLDKSFIDNLRTAQSDLKIVQTETLFNGKDGHIEVRNSSIEGGAPLMTIGFPLAKDEFGIVTHVVLADVRLDRMQKVFAAMSDRTLYLVDDKGKLLAHPDESKVLKGEIWRPCRSFVRHLCPSSSRGSLVTSTRARRSRSLRLTQRRRWV